MVVTRSFFRHTLSNQRPLIFRGAKTPDAPKIDYFVRYPEEDAFDDLTFTYTPEKPNLFVNIHIGKRDKQYPDLDGIKVNGVVVPFQYDGNRYYDYSAVASILLQGVIPGEELTFEVKLGKTGSWPSMGNGAIHIHEIQTIGEVLYHGAAKTSGSTGWSVGINPGGHPFEAGDILMGSIYAPKAIQAPIRGYNYIRGQYPIRNDWSWSSLNQFELGEAQYAAGNIAYRFTQNDIDTQRVENGMGFTTSGIGTIGYLSLRGSSFD